MDERTTDELPPVAEGADVGGDPEPEDGFEGVDGDDEDGDVGEGDADGPVDLLGEPQAQEQWSAGPTSAGPTSAGPTTGTGPSARKFEAVEVPLEEIEPAPINPNAMDKATFNTLVEGLNEDGPIQPMVVVPLKVPHDGLKYRIVMGEHRWRAAKSLNWATFPAVIRPDWDDLAATTRLVKDNVVRGTIDKDKFTELSKMLQRDYQLDLDLQAAMMGFDTTKEMLKHVEFEARQRAVDEQAQLDTSKHQLKVLDDLSMVLNFLFTKFGRTLAQSWMVFVFGGKIHLLVEMDKDLRVVMDQVTRIADERKVDINILLKAMLSDAIGQYRPQWLGADADEPGMMATAEAEADRLAALQAGALASPTSPLAETPEPEAAENESVRDSIDNR
jgi:hypothetical protein